MYYTTLVAMTMIVFIIHTVAYLGDLNVSDGGTWPLCGTMAGMGPATPHAFYTKLYAQNDFVILRVISQRMSLTAGKLRLLPTESTVSSTTPIIRTPCS